MSCNPDPIMAYLTRDRRADEQRHRCGCHRTKIVATIGPASEAPEILRDMITAGLDVARLNMSHGTHDDHRRRLLAVRQVATDLGRPVAVLADLQGPKIRLGRFGGDGSTTWPVGLRVVISCRADEPAGSAERVGTTYLGLCRDVKPGDAVLVDDGKLRLRVERVAGTEVHLVVEIGGLVRSNKGINLPGVATSTPALSSKDLEDLAWALAQPVDYLALSFVRSAEDVLDLRKRITASGSTIPIIAKIEKPEAVERLPAILQAADGLMVARGDLGIELSTARLPVVQKHLIAAANRAGKLVITATQMLESMIDNPVPTRAESNDVANAILDGSDAVMLSGETAMGRHPVAAVAEMRRIAQEAEYSPYFHPQELDPALAGFPARALAITRAADRLAEDLGAAASLIFTTDSDDALLLAKHRPQPPALVFVPTATLQARLALHWGLTPVLLAPWPTHTADRIRAGIAAARQRGLLVDGRPLIVLHAGTGPALDTLRIVETR